MTELDEVLKELEKAVDDLTHKFHRFWIGLILSILMLLIGLIFLIRELIK